MNHLPCTGMHLPVASTICVAHDMMLGIIIESWYAASGESTRNPFLLRNYRPSGNFQLLWHNASFSLESLGCTATATASCLKANAQVGRWH